jgi:hypothetical protein
LAQQIPPVPQSPAEKSPNYLAIIAGILTFVSLALPWWVVTVWYSSMGYFSDEATLYLYEAKVSVMITKGLFIMGTSSTGVTHPWYASTALVFLVLGGLLGLTSGVIANKRKIVLTLGLILTLFSLIIFAAGLQNDISNGAMGLYPRGASLFSSGSFTYSYLATSINYSGYLSFGFWLSLVAAIIMLVALTRRPTVAN